MSFSVQAQQTGSFSLFIDFNEPDYSLSNELAFYVPTDYDAQNSYPLIVGFRGGPHSGPGHLRDQLQPLSDNLNAIIMCPESVALWQGGQEDLVKPLFQHAVDTTASLYTIDMEMIYVTGLSFGGRHTVLVGMDTDSGPIYPGLRGIIPFAAGTNSENIADYGVDTSAPICTCIGSNDASFYNVSYILNQNATAAGHSTLFNEIPGVGHTMAFPTFIDEMMECFDFIEAQYTTGLAEYDAFELEVFPNPVRDELQLMFMIGSVARVDIFNSKGQMVQSTELQPFDTLGCLDVSELSKGAYLIKVVNANENNSNGVKGIVQEQSSRWIIKE
jgi:hypothetical protein